MSQPIQFSLRGLMVLVGGAAVIAWASLLLGSLLLTFVMQRMAIFLFVAAFGSFGFGFRWLIERRKPPSN